MTTLLFAAGVAAIVAGIAAWSIPLAAIVAGVALVALAVLLERGGTAEPDAAETPSTMPPRNPKE